MKALFFGSRSSRGQSAMQDARPAWPGETKLKLATWSSAKEICERAIRNGFGILVRTSFSF
jgi:hypothetical protein